MYYVHNFSEGTCDRCGVFHELIHDRTGLCEQCYGEILQDDYL
jgi:hypothetical protein